MQGLVKMINGTDASLGVTLQVGGLLVSGTLVSGHKYFSGVGAELAAATPGSDETKERLRSTISRLGENFTKPADGNEPKPLPQYIHLKEARFFHVGGKPIPSNNGVWWRGRLSEVGGFCLGILDMQG
ncbi:hypothetical protein GF068_00060 [Polyangium spumosum]|uniref:Gas vesicle protein n=1 Tax=Polyangium spumosum TaxID=889282 RepID=A0A6N7PJQ1_9BACT|nr:hypothetical protein [Polyangium spumosum]